jgi:hypothetical protein
VSDPFLQSAMRLDREFSHVIPPNMRVVPQAHYHTVGLYPASRYDHTRA